MKRPRLAQGTNLLRYEKGDTFCTNIQKKTMQLLGSRRQLEQSSYEIGS